MVTQWVTLGHDVSDKGGHFLRVCSDCKRIEFCENMHSQDNHTISIGYQFTDGEAHLHMRTGQFAIDNSTYPFELSKRNSQGVVWSESQAARTPGIVLNSIAQDRPEISYYRGGRTRPEFSIRMHTDGDKGAEIYSGDGQATPEMTMAFNRGKVGIGTSNPTKLLEVGGDVYVGGELETQNGVLVSGVYCDGDIGIGIQSPDSALHIYNGNMRFETDSSDLSLLFTDNDDNSTIGFLFDKSEEKLSVVGGMAGDRTPSFLDDIMTFTRGFRVGIKNSTPTCELDINGDVKISGDLTIDTNLTVNGVIAPLQFASSSGAKLNFYSTTYAIGVESSELRIASNGDITFRTDGYEGDVNVIITDSGYVGIGIAMPHDDLHIAGTSPSFILEESDALDSEKVWELTATGGMLKLLAQSDLYTATQTVFEIDRGGTSPTTFCIPNSKVGIRTTNLSGQLTVDQPVASGGIPVITVDQGDVDQPFFEFLSGTIYGGMSGTNKYLKVKADGGGTYYLRLFN